jgi:aryl-alcohol dehydrogenase-like predicted oxidoreductase
MNQKPDDTLTLGRTGLRVCRIGLGAMVWGSPTGIDRWTPAQLAYGPSDGIIEEQLALDASLAAGVNLIDTAAIYSNGASERRVGELTQKIEILIATKFPATFFARTKSLPSALESSLNRLRRHTIDLYQIHYPSPWMSIPELMNLMAAATGAGKIRAIGVSNYTAEQMRVAHASLARRGIPLASNQVQYSLVCRKPEVDGVLDACRELGITLIAYSPLGMGALTGKYSATKRATGIRSFTPNFRGNGIQAVQKVVEMLREIGQRYSKTPSQVALRWLIQQENVIAIPGAKNSKQATENAGALGFSLTQSEIDTLDQATMAWRN